MENWWGSWQLQPGFKVEQRESHIKPFVFDTFINMKQLLAAETSGSWVSVTTFVYVLLRRLSANMWGFQRKAAPYDVHQSIARILLLSKCSQLFGLWSLADSASQHQPSSRSRRGESGEATEWLSKMLFFFCCCWPNCFYALPAETFFWDDGVLLYLQKQGKTNCSHCLKPSDASIFVSPEKCSIMPLFFFSQWATPIFHKLPIFSIFFST